MRLLLSLPLIALLLDQTPRLDKLPLLALLGLSECHQEILLPCLLLVCRGVRLLLQLFATLGAELPVGLAFSDGCNTFVLIGLSALETTVKDGMVDFILVSVNASN